MVAADGRRAQAEDAAGQHRCLIGALYHVRQRQRIRGAGTENYVCAAAIETDNPELDPLLVGFIARGLYDKTSSIWRLL